MNCHMSMIHTVTFLQSNITIFWCIATPLTALHWFQTCKEIQSSLQVLKANYEKVNKVQMLHAGEGRPDPPIWQQIATPWHLWFFTCPIQCFLLLCSPTHLETLLFSCLDLMDELDSMQWYDGAISGISGSLAQLRQPVKADNTVTPGIPFDQSTLRESVVWVL